MGNLVLNSAEEPENLRATTGTVEVPTKRDNDVALAIGAETVSKVRGHISSGAKRWKFF